MKIIKLLAFSTIFMWSSVSFAGVLIDEWPDGLLYKYCKYSDNVVIKIKYYKMCPITI